MRGAGSHCADAEAQVVAARVGSVRARVAARGSCGRDLRGEPRAAVARGGRDHEARWADPALPCRHHCRCRTGRRGRGVRRRRDARCQVRPRSHVVALCSDRRARQPHDDRAQPRHNRRPAHACRASARLATADLGRPVRDGSGVVGEHRELAATGLEPHQPARR